MRAGSERFVRGLISKTIFYVQCVLIPLSHSLPFLLNRSAINSVCEMRLLTLRGFSK